MQIGQIQIKSASALTSDRKHEENKAAIQSDFHTYKKKCICPCVIHQGHISP